MNEMEFKAVQAELNAACAREGRYLAAWLESFPDGDVCGVPEPAELVQRYHALLPVQERLIARQALLEKDEVQAVLWIGSWRIFQWPPAKRIVRQSLRLARKVLRP